MPIHVPALVPRDPNATIIAWFERIENACLALLILISTLNLAAWLNPLPIWTFLAEWFPMRAESAFAALLCTLCLMFHGTGKARLTRWISPLFAGIVISLALRAMLKYSLPYLPELTRRIALANGLVDRTNMSSLSAAAFLLLGLTMGAMSIHRRFAFWLSDILALCTCLLTLTLVSGHMYGKWSIIGIPADVPTLRGTLVCLSLLTLYTCLRRTDGGIFSVYVGNGNAGKLARVLSPILLIMPFVRETTRARIIGAGKMPAHYVTALMASIAAIISISLLLYLVWRINTMETEIHGLALHDELTGLNNLRGFQLLAQQAMRMAQRAKVPFSVMFIDLDDLKIINDTLGHNLGSEYIAEAAELLQSNFRESDVLGRIGGDEFAVAGQFSRRAVWAAQQKIKDACAKKNSERDRQYRLSLSIGHSTLDETNPATLSELMAQADGAMYEVKRLKKAKRGLPSSEALPEGGTVTS